MKLAQILVLSMFCYVLYLQTFKWLLLKKVQSHYSHSLRVTQCYVLSC